MPRENFIPSDGIIPRRTASVKLDDASSAQFVNKRKISGFLLDFIKQLPYT